MSGIHNGVLMAIDVSLGLYRIVFRIPYSVHCSKRDRRAASGASDQAGNSDGRRRVSSGPEAGSIPASWQVM